MFTDYLMNTSGLVMKLHVIFRDCSKHINLVLLAGLVVSTEPFLDEMEERANAMFYTHKTVLNNYLSTTKLSMSIII
jgi:hypothetical protein